MIRTGTLLLLPALFLGGPAEPGSLPPDSDGEGDPPALATLLAVAAERPESHDLRLLVECRREGALESMEVFGRGLAIWDGRRQFELSQERVGELLETLLEAGFAAMPESFGGREPGDPATPPRPPGALLALVVICRVDLELDGVSKRVVQLDKGEQSETFRELAERLLRVGREAARSGLDAEDLQDGLAKLARGELAPETLSAVFHRRPERPEEAPAGEGFLLSVDGFEVRLRNYIPYSGYEDPVVLELTAAEVAAVAAELAARQPGELPVNLWAPAYTDLAIEVLGHRKAVQARSFSGMTATTHGRRQQDFDALAAVFTALRERAIDEGVAEPE